MQVTECMSELSEILTASRHAALDGIIFLTQAFSFA